ncbi:type IV secretion system protein [Janthinobacterium lividum]|jgi:type IV secretory pathway VirB6-like protein|uniref:type IV secretion system protein n=1 Tax=Janthinobacterium sp. YR213 TaxID=1881027 RepID=UPI000B848BAE|nr:type IV secretion system protein [Janthinobacterium sp. YR213]
MEMKKYNQIKSIFLAMLLVMCAVFASSAAAASSAEGNKAPGAFFDKLDNGVKNIQENARRPIATTLFDAGLTIAFRTIPWALAIAGSLAVLYMIIEAMGVLSGKNGSMLTVIFDVGLPVVLCSYLLLKYPTVIKDFAGADGPLQFIRMIGGDAITSVFNMYSSILKMIASAISNSTATVLKTASFFNLDNTMVAIFDALITVIFALAIILLCFVGLAEIMGLLLMGPFLTAVAVAFGPIFIAGIVTPWTREYFSKWLGFLVAAAVLTGVLGVSVSIAATLFEQFGFAEVVASPTPTAIGMLIATITLMSINSLIQQTPAIANALVPGSFGATKTAGAAVKDGAKTAKDAAKSVSGGAGKIRKAAMAKILPGKKTS